MSDDLTDEERELEGSRMPFLAHLDDLRKRLVIILIGVAIGFGIAYKFSPEILAFLKRPYEGNLLALSPTEAFMTNLKVGLFGGIVLAMPLIIHQIWAFIGPGLYRRERKVTLPVVILGSLFFCLGAAFAYAIILPYGLMFLAKVAPPFVESQYRLEFYVTFVTRTMIAFGAVFELPLIAYFLTKLGVIDADFLVKNRKYAVVVMFIAAAVLTPGPDVFTQLMMAGPLLGLYETSVFVAKRVEKRAQAREEAERAAEAARAQGAGAGNA